MLTCGRCRWTQWLLLQQKCTQDVVVGALVVGHAQPVPDLLGETGRVTFFGGGQLVGTITLTVVRDGMALMLRLNS